MIENNDLFDCVRTEILKHLPLTNQSERETLASMPIHTLLVRFHNWNKRFIPCFPRQIIKSTEFEFQFLNASSSRYEALECVISEIQQGIDLTPRLSKQVKNKPLDNDLMLNEWGIYHLHLGKLEPSSKEWVGRTGDLLFLLFKDDKTFIIGVYDHNSWSKEEIVQVCITNWEKLNFFIEIKGIVPRSHLSEENRKTLRRKHCNSFLTINNKSYAGNYPLSSAGTSLDSCFFANIFLSKLEDFEQEWAKNPEIIRQQLTDKGYRLPENPIREFKFFRGANNILHYGFKEIQSQYFFSIGLVN
jgi:hypothetical protein